MYIEVSVDCMKWKRIRKQTFIRISDFRKIYINHYNYLKTYQVETFSFYL